MVAKVYVVPMPRAEVVDPSIDRIGQEERDQQGWKILKASRSAGVAYRWNLRKPSVSVFLSKKRLAASSVQRPESSLALFVSSVVTARLEMSLDPIISPDTRGNR